MPLAACSLILAMTGERPMAAGLVGAPSGLEPFSAAVLAPALGAPTLMRWRCSRSCAGCRPALAQARQAQRVMLRRLSSVGVEGDARPRVQRADGTVNKVNTIIGPDDSGGWSGRAGRRHGGFSTGEIRRERRDQAADVEDQRPRRPSPMMMVAPRRRRPCGSSSSGFSPPPAAGQQLVDQQGDAPALGLRRPP